MSSLVGGMAKAKRKHFGATSQTPMDDIDVSYFFFILV
jgi:hypothetical protein